MQVLLAIPLLILVLMLRWIEANPWSALVIVVLTASFYHMNESFNQQEARTKRIPPRSKLFVFAASFSTSVFIVTMLRVALVQEPPSSPQVHYVVDQQALKESEYQAFKKWTYCAAPYSRRPGDGLPDKDGMNRSCGPEPYYDGKREALRRMYAEDPSFKQHVVDKQIESCRDRYKSKIAQENCIQHVRTFYYR